VGGRLWRICRGVNDPQKNSGQMDAFQHILPAYEIMVVQIILLGTHLHRSPVSILKQSANLHTALSHTSGLTLIKRLKPGYPHASFIP